MARKHQHHDEDGATGYRCIAYAVLVVGIGRSDAPDSRCSFLLFEKSLQEILAFLFEILRLSRAFEKIVQRFLYFLFRLFLNLGRQGP